MDGYGRRQPCMPNMSARVHDCLHFGGGEGGEGGAALHSNYTLAHHSGFCANLTAPTSSGFGPSDMCVMYSSPFPAMEWNHAILYELHEVPVCQKQIRSQQKMRRGIRIRT